jgi:hypothetical protein
MIDFRFYSETKKNVSSPLIGLLWSSDTDPFEMERFRLIVNMVRLLGNVNFTLII